MATKNGTVKKTPVEDFKNVRKSGLIAIKLRPNDSLEWVRESSKGNEVVLVTREGKCIRFNEEDSRPLGRPSIGVLGIRLKGSDNVVEMAIVPNPETELLVVMENGLGKMTKITNYRLQSRGGSGVKTANITAKTGKVIGAKTLDNTTNADLVMMSKSGQVIRIDSKDIPSQGRATQGVYLMRLDSGDKVASISLIDHVDSSAPTKEEKIEETVDQQELIKTAS